MDEYKADTYGERIAGAYDAFYPTAEEHSIVFLTQMSKGKRVLELGIGTGRIALPLKANGIDIHGIDASKAMIDRLREKQSGDNIPVTVGDFSNLSDQGTFDVIFVVASTFFGLTTQDLQLKCLRETRKHLSENGRFLVEAFVPDVARFTDGQAVRSAGMNETEVQLNISQHDRMSQKIVSQQVILTERGIKMYPVTIRYVWPSELDMMALAAGFELLDRWEDWQKTPFSSKSQKHVSVYGLL